mmetsp:Transcript_6633/g.14708  ORF Transcript_6633/g.14708 Transcript_6633/m.14708 type:complete len:432 (+) Transcript_6633:231-1526(+)|eukprot:CAMPEP_0183714418 /NCGR_PEP_ID=MMETSP0737-20130205/8933_1 /TAXON_ID=385413 /ORGANISM="Thalassiosira miniscula, Strain CCMP1093" /LENGTH=431 /DNA_ID=CAMNT_0025943341 /DNA_START=143 /DNA_END=1438 /DNA_ORIENTATION=+
MVSRNKIATFLPLLSLLFASPTMVDAKDAIVGGASSPEHHQSIRFSHRRRRRLGGGQGRQHWHWQEDDASETQEDSIKEDRDAKDKDAFYDLSLMTKEERLDMIKKAYALVEYGDSVDWDDQRENFVKTVREDSQRSRSRSQESESQRSRSRSSDANVDAPAAVGAKSKEEEYKGRTDDTLYFFDSFDDVKDNGDEVTVRGSDGGDVSGGEMDEKLKDGLAVDNEREESLVYDDATVQPESQPYLQTSRRRLQKNNIDGDVFDKYEYNRGSCPNAGALGVPCAPNNLSALCNKYDRKRGSFRTCLEACAPAFCCIHDAPPDKNFLAPNCNTDENCPQYNYCYIAWWKLHDTVGPALFLRVEQDDEFFDMDAEEIQEDSTGDALFTQVLLHHFDDINKVIEDGTVDNEFNADRIFLDEAYWVYPVANVVDMP